MCTDWIGVIASVVLRYLLNGVLGYNWNEYVTIVKGTTCCCCSVFVCNCILIMGYTYICICVYMYAYFTLAFLLIIVPTGTDMTAFSCPNVWRQIYVCVGHWILTMHTYGGTKGSEATIKLYPTGWVFKFLHLLYVKHEYSCEQKNINYEINITLWTICFWHVLKTQQISLLTKHMNGISRGAFLCASSI